MSFLSGMPFPVQFFLAFVIVLGLIGVTAWAVRRFGSGRLGGSSIRGRQPRLGVVDYASVDARRRLILVRRDNVEHLVMIGGPTDILVESNIVRAVAPQRETAAAPSREVAVVRQPAAAAAVEATPRAIPLPDRTGYPPSHEPAVTPGPMRAPRGDTASEDAPVVPTQPQPDAAPRPQRETLVALADELSSRPAVPVRNRMQATARPQPPELRPEQRSESRQEPRPEPRVSAPQPAVADSASPADQTLAEMAHRLEAALRKPAAKVERSEPRGVPMPRAVVPAAEFGAPADVATAVAASPPVAPSPILRAPRTSEVKPPRADSKKTNPGKALYDSLEQEMASLLGRPTAKN